MLSVWRATNTPSPRSTTATSIFRRAAHCRTAAAIDAMVVVGVTGRNIASPRATRAIATSTMDSSRPSESLVLTERAAHGGAAVSVAR
jgi:hypothetical protein